jgi:hypothetical protein
MTKVAPYSWDMKGFGKLALLFGLLGGLMAYFIVPLHFSRKRNLSPTDKAEYALTVDYYKSHCGPVIEEIEERARVYAHESGQDIWAGFCNGGAPERRHLATQVGFGSVRSERRAGPISRPFPAKPWALPSRW